MDKGYLFNSSGEYIAYKCDKRLFLTNCINVGYFINDEVVYDLDGDYLGHIVFTNRLMHKNGYNPGRIGRVNKAINIARLSLPSKLPCMNISGYTDVKLD